VTGIRGIIFDLDGVIVSTDEFHFQAWKQLADAEGIPFTRENNHRLRGVSRMESLDILLERGDRFYSTAEKFEMAERKNAAYRELLGALSPRDLLPGVRRFLDDAKALDLRLAIGSSSRNARQILQSIGLENEFDAVVDGTDILKSKPDPEVFVLAASRLALLPEECLVVEDADAGVDAAIAAGMRVLAVGAAATNPRATCFAPDLSAITIAELIGAE
jgi:beta-phosphoglucomutase